MNINIENGKVKKSLLSGTKYARRSTAASFFLPDSQLDCDALFNQLSKVIGHLEHWENNSKYYQLKRRKLEDCVSAINEQEAFNQLYIIQTRGHSGVKFSQKFTKVSESKAFWKINYLRKDMYDYLLKVSEQLDLSLRTYLRAIMLTDTYLLEHMDRIIDFHQNTPQNIPIILQHIVIASLFLSHKCESSVIYSRRAFAFLLNPEYERFFNIASFEEDILETCGYDACFDTYIDIIDYELVRNYYGASEFTLIKLISENILLQTVVVDDSFLSVDVNVYCLALIILTLKLMYDTFVRLCIQRGIKKNFDDLKRQQFLHEQNILSNSGYNPSVVLSVVQTIKQRLAESDETDPEYPQAILQVAQSIRVFLDSLEKV